MSGCRKRSAGRSCSSTSRCRPRAAPRSRIATPCATRSRAGSTAASATTTRADATRAAAARAAAAAANIGAVTAAIAAELDFPPPGGKRLMIIRSEADVAQAVLAEMHRTPDARTREVLSNLVKHLHAFIRETRLTER